ncbi:MAG: type II toxin-antitoxin system HicA family toxin [Chloroflexota bacterium]|nr:type II toxin-antitoxin system HicA family toxin [Chloroflexota bacterium]
MSPKLPRLDARRVVAALKRDGWYEHHQRGSHLAMRHHEKPGQVTVQIHAGSDIHPITLKSIFRQAGLTESDFLKLLKGR